MQNISGRTRTVALFKISDLGILKKMALGFFMSRLILFGTVNPIIISYLSLFLDSNLKFYLIVFAVAIGLFTKLTGVYFIKYLVNIFLLGLINIFTRKSNLFFKALSSFFCTLLSGLFILFFAETGSFVLTFIESILAFIFVYIFQPAFKFFDDSKSLANDEALSIAVILGSAAAGMNDVFIAGISFFVVFSVFILLIIGTNYSSSYSSMFGLILGIILNFSGQIGFSEVIILSLTGIFAGIFKYKKLANIISLIFFSPVIILYLKPSLMTKSLFLSGLISIIFFMILPTNFVFEKTIDKDEYVSRIKNMISYRLKSFSDSFKKLAVTFNNLSQKKSALDKKDISKLIDDIASKSCSNCSMRVFCWENNFYDTYRAVFSILSACERKGKVNTSDIPESFASNCTSLNRFIDNTNKLFEIYKINLAWNNKIIESRELISQQLSGVSDIIKNLACELDLEMRFDKDAESKIVNALSKNNIDFESATAIKNKDGRHEIEIIIKSCGNQKNCTKKILPVISQSLDTNMIIQKNYCVSDHGRCALKFIERQKFSMIAGVSRCAKKNSLESGDCYSVIELKNGQCALVLSDGMGSGKAAKTESTATVELLEDFMESGFDKNTAVKIINSVLVLKSNDDFFSTLDMCFIDLYSGAAEFVKTGASVSFLYRDGNLQIIKASSLPIGILTNIELEVFSKNFRGGDIIIMMTDGVFDTAEKVQDKKEWLLNILLALNSNNPQDISDCIIEQAKSVNNNAVKDDMTVLVARIWEKFK